MNRIPSILLFLFFTVVSLPVFAQDSSFEQEVLQYTNEFRATKGLPPLTMNEAISTEARHHSADMATGRSEFGHDGFDDRIKTITKKIGKVKAAAENVAYGQLDAKKVVDRWSKSPGHRKNMLGNYALIGIGIVRGEGNMLYFTQIFAKQ